MSSFRILIVGGGIAGLATAIALRRSNREIIVLEKSRMLKEVGALISLQPNAMRIVSRWDITSFLQNAEPILDEAFKILDINGKPVANIPTKEHCGARRTIFHRQDLHNALKAAALSESLPGEPVHIRTGAAVARCDAENGIVHLESGEKIEGDLVIGADGIRSALRESILGDRVDSVPTGLSAYRALVDIDKIDSLDCDKNVFDPQKPVTTMIVGHDRRIIMGPGRGSKILGMVALVPDEKLSDISAAESWTSEGSLDELIEAYRDFPPWVQTIFRAAPDLALWQLRDIEPLMRWHKGRAILIGDAAHAMLPTQGQGASQSVEDAEALAAFLDETDGRPSKEKIEERLNLVFQARHVRATKIQGYSRQQARPGTKVGSSEVTISPEEFSSYNLEYYGAKEWLARQEVEVEEPACIEPALAQAMSTVAV
jgi:salicylate hydroxylase